jgi:hypothetical protein
MGADGAQTLNDGRAYYYIAIEQRGLTVQD